MPADNLNSNQSANFIPGDGIDITWDEDEGEYTDITIEATAGGGADTEHREDTADAHDASAISFVPAGTIAATDVQAAIEEVASEAGGGGAPTDADYLVGTANGSLSAEIVVGTTPGGELGGTWASPTVDATHAGSTHSAAVDTHIADTTDVHDHGSLAGLTDDDHTQYLKEADFDDVDFLVGTATGHTGAEIVVGTSPGGELGGTWASPTVDATHSGSTHGAAVTTHEAAADPHTGYLKESDFDDIDFLVGTATGHTAAEIVVGTSPGGELGGTWASPTVDATHSGSTHGAAVTTHEAAGDPHTGYRLESADHSHQSTGAQAGTLDHGLALTGLTDDDHTIYRKEADPVHLVTFTKTGNLSTGTGTTRWYNDTGANITLDSARGSVGTAPASQSILVDVNNNGTSVWNATQANRITIAAASNTDEGGAFDDSTIADGEYITVDIDQVGSGTVGADLTVSIWGHYSL